MMAWFIGFAIFIAGLLIGLGLFRVADALDQIARNVGNAGDRMRDEQRRTARAAELIAEDFREVTRRHA